MQRLILMSPLEASVNKIVRDQRTAKCLPTTRALALVICTHRPLLIGEGTSDVERAGVRRSEPLSLPTCSFAFRPFVPTLTSAATFCATLPHRLASFRIDLRLPSTFLANARDFSACRIGR